MKCDSHFSYITALEARRIAYFNGLGVNEEHNDIILEDVPFYYRSGSVKLVLDFLMDAFNVATNEATYQLNHLFKTRMGINDYVTGLIFDLRRNDLDFKIEITTHNNERAIITPFVFSIRNKANIKGRIQDKPSTFMDMLAYAHFINSQRIEREAIVGALNESQWYKSDRLICGERSHCVAHTVNYSRELVSYLSENLSTLRSIQLKQNQIIFNHAVKKRQLRENVVDIGFRAKNNRAYFAPRLDSIL